MIDRYIHKKIHSLWQDENKYSLWTKIELTFLKHLKGISFPIPASFSSEWIRRISEIEEVTRHDVAAFVQWLEEYTDCRFVHYGLTSSDIVDTAFSMMIRDSEKIISDLCTELIDTLNQLIERVNDTTILGRTHGQVAEVMPLKNKFISYRNIISHLSPKSRYYGRLAGSVGDYKYFDKSIEHKTLSDLELEVCPVNDGQIIHRAVYAEYLNKWALLASSIAKIATDIRLMSQSGIEEIREGFFKHQMGSSSMPQKRNPILCENLCGLARLIRGYQTTVMQDIELWNERDISHSSAERVCFPDASIILGFMVSRINTVLKNLEINKESMSVNLERYWSDVDSQRQMLKLIDDGVSRVEAHRAISKR